LNDNRIHYFWDSCVFIRYLLNEPGAKFLRDISQYIEDAKNGKIQIHFSTIALAEIKPSHLHKRGYGDAHDFLEDFKGAFAPIGPSPDIFARSASIRDISYPNPNGGSARVVGTADAVHLITCLFARDELDLPNIVFHTLDDGKGKNWEGKCVPLLSFEKWTDGIPKNPYVPKICCLPREPPEHPEIGLF
jgi:hypothetical protein